jgi:DNA-binding SARP family transcriptional activator
VHFGLLGPLMVADEAGGAVEVSGPRVRVLLATLLLQANSPVSTDMLTETVWDRTPPPGAARTLRSHVGRLRQQLGTEAGRVKAREPGYLIQIGADELDVTAFETLCRDAGTALRAGDWAVAADVTARALRLWRGAPLLDIPSQPLHERVVLHLEQLCLQAREDSMQAQLQLGWHGRLVPQLRDLTAQHPLHERFHAQLMLALARSGRHAEALAAYQHVRRVLIAELGVEPGAELRDLHEGILANDTGLPTATAPPSQRSRPDGVSWPVPRQLPAAVQHFVGRARELNALSEFLSQSVRAPEPEV